MPEARLKFPRLRIAWSAAWGGLCATLIGVCSILLYYNHDILLIDRSGHGLTRIEIYHGKLALSGKPSIPYRPQWAGQTNRYGFRYNRYSEGQWYVYGPLWMAGALLAVAIAFVAAYPWLRWRFSLRALLIAMAIVAGAFAGVAMLLQGLAPPVPS